MPTINQSTSIVITPEKFLESCSNTELHEVALLIQSRRFQQRLENAGCECVSALAMHRCQHYRAGKCQRPGDIGGLPDASDRELPL